MIHAEKMSLGITASDADEDSLYSYCNTVQGLRP